MRILSLYPWIDLVMFAALKEARSMVEHMSNQIHYDFYRITHSLFSSEIYTSDTQNGTLQYVDQTGSQLEE